MPWKVCKPMDERLKFIARLLDGEKMAVRCREFETPARPATRSTLDTRAAGWRAARSLPKALSACPPAALSDREGDRDVNIVPAETDKARVPRAETVFQSREATAQRTPAYRTDNWIRYTRIRGGSHCCVR